LLFGSRWHEAGYVLAAASVALMIGAPLSLAVAGYLYAVGALQAVLRSAVLHTVVWIGLTLALLPVIGVTAVGVAHIPAAAVDAIVLGRAAKAASGARVARALPLPTSAAIVAGGIAFLVANVGQPSVGRAAAAILIAVIGYGALLALAIVLSPSGRTAESVRRLRVLAKTRGRHRLLVPPTHVDVSPAPQVVGVSAQALRTARDGV
jgi:hypothetical protein